MIAWVFQSILFTMKARFKKVYVLAPYMHATGGVELSHQLVDCINNLGGDAYIVYEKDDVIVKADSVTPQYAKYNIRIATEVEDSADNIFVAPEIYLDWIYRYSDIRFACWWMSVDNHFTAAHWRDSLMFRCGLRQKYWIMRSCLSAGRKNTFAMMKRRADRLYHFYQSVYAQNFLYGKQLTNVLPLGDYINSELCEVSGDRHREDVVLYNPSKGLRYTKKIIKALPDVKFIPLVGMTREELRDHMQTAKVYIDFGNFPGKDRLPREAVMNGLCIITGKNGASYYYEDVAIDSQYKFDATSSNVSKIAKSIREVLKNFDAHSKNFESYRARIRREKAEFQTQVRNLFFEE